MRVPVLSLLLSSALARPAITSVQFVDQEKTLSDYSSLSSEGDSISLPVADADQAASPTLADDDDDSLEATTNALEQMLEKANADVASLREEREELLTIIAAREDILEQIWAVTLAESRANRPMIADVTEILEASWSGADGSISDPKVNFIVSLIGCTFIFLLLISLIGLCVLLRVLSARRRKHTHRSRDKIGHHHCRCFRRGMSGQDPKPGEERQTPPPHLQQNAQQPWLQRQDKALLSEKNTIAGKFAYTDKECSSNESTRNTSMEDELASLREIVDVVGDMVTAEEGRQVSRGHVHSDDLPRYEDYRQGRPPSYKEQVSDDEETH